MTKADIEKIILDSIQNYNEDLEKPVDISKGSETILFGGGGHSIQLTSLT